jgi:hypothetical protein
MQKIATYLLERREGLENLNARNNEYSLIKAKIFEWLHQFKGATDTGNIGTFTPEDDSIGVFNIQEAFDGDHNWWMVELQEDSNDGKRFITSVSIITGESTVSVYATLEIGWTTTRVMPLFADARCPRIVRRLLEINGNWYNGTSIIEKRRVITDFEDGERLANDILDSKRSIPIIVVSTRNGAVILPELDIKLEYDLAGLANIVCLGENAAWALTDSLGTKWCCYWGAVRIFWPSFSLDQERFSHPLWTADRLYRQNINLLDIQKAFRSQLRRLIFRASVLSVNKPVLIDKIRDASSQRTIFELSQRAASLEEFKELADIYSTENISLRSERNYLKNHVDELRSQISHLERDKLALQWHLQSSKDSGIEKEEISDIQPSVETIEGECKEPIPGEVRYYKKVFSRPTHDVFVIISDCEHNRWQSATKADKARKGIAKLENGRTDWKSIQHCATCTGGGVWKVQW